MRAHGLTPLQRDVLYAIAEMTEGSHVSPSVSELCAELEICRSSCHRAIHALVARGWIAIRPACARSITLLRSVVPPAGHYAPYEWSLAPALQAAG